MDRSLADHPSSRARFLPPTNRRRRMSVLALCTAFGAGALCAALGGALVGPALAEAGWGVPAFKAAPGPSGDAPSDGLTWEVDPNGVRLWVDDPETGFLVVAEGTEDYPLDDADASIQHAWDTGTTEVPTQGLKSLMVYRLVPAAVLDGDTMRPCNENSPIICPTPGRPMPIPPKPRADVRVVSHD